MFFIGDVFFSCNHKLIFQIVTNLLVLILKELIFFEHVNILNYNYEKKFNS